MGIEHCLEQLIKYGRLKGFFGARDTRYVRNRLLELLQYPDYPGVPEEDVSPDRDLEDIMDELLTWAAGRGLLPGNSSLYRDLLDAALMGALLPRPSEVEETFARLYRESPPRATGYLFDLSTAANYIRRGRTGRNLAWSHASPYGDMEITINLAKPEKTVREIEAERKAPPGSYPRCLLCAENEGYGGRLNHPARQNLRLVQLSLGGEPWYFQYSPYLYYPEHCIVLSEAHVPMAVNRKTLERMLDFLDILPHYFIGANADLPVVGGSILNHDHFQGGRHCFPMDGAGERRSLNIPGCPSVRASLLRWPLAVIRLTAADREKLLAAGAAVLAGWQDYRDDAAGIIPRSGGEPHNTVTTIARRKERSYQLDLVLRNNRRDARHPEGIFHPHRALHNIKQENIGLIEVMGRAVLPPRLQPEMALMKTYLLTGRVEAEEREALHKHLALCGEIREQHPGIHEGNVESLLKEAVGEKFVLALRHAGVFKEDARGRERFAAFIRSLGWQALQEIPARPGAAGKEG